jgi:pimeloyl-ACP methyl ester carboxylesterase
MEIKPTWPIPPGLKWEAVNGYPLSYRDEGTGRPATVLLHGSITDYRTWDGQFGVLTQKHRVVAPSLRHFYPERWQGGGSGFSIEQHASDVAALIRKLGLGRVHLVGWSRGGTVAIEIAKQNPDVIRTLVMADGSIVMPVPETPESKKAAEFTKNNIQTLQENLKAGDPNRAAKVIIDAVDGPNAWESAPETFKEMVLANIYTAMGDKSRPSTTCDDLRKFEFPVLLMTGEKSPKSFALLYDEMRKCKNFGATTVIPNAAHGIHRMNPKAYNETILAFVGQHGM